MRGYHVDCKACIRCQSSINRKWILVVVHWKVLGESMRNIKSHVMLKYWHGQSLNKRKDQLIKG